MSDLDVETVETPAKGEGFVVVCWKCSTKFDATSSRWCGCDGKLRTLQCPHCSSCFCPAPFTYRRRFWIDAPKSLRENSSRFRVPTPVALVSGTDRARGSAGSLLHPGHVLIVDDEEPIRSLAACYVERLGYSVTTVSSAEEALLMTEMGLIDIVLTDALMPGMDGRELCRIVKERHGDEVKVILMTALYTARHYQTEARHVFKVDEFLTKPLRYGDLREALQRVAPARRLGGSTAALTG